MTSRVRRIVLAMYGHHRSSRVVSSAYGVSENFSRGLDTLFRPCGCYEAMDEPDGLIGVTDTSWADSLGRPPRLLVGGNYGLPCA